VLADSRDPTGDGTDEPEHATPGEASLDAAEMDPEADHDADPRGDAVGLWTGESSPVSMP
jgi:hypothetical protein